MNTQVGAPGIGGSLGKCGLCGKPFIGEILFGEPVASVVVNSISDQELFMHNKCLEKMKELKGRAWTELPPGPLRECYEEANKKGRLEES